MQECIVEQGRANQVIFFNIWIFRERERERERKRKIPLLSPKKILVQIFTFSVQYSTVFSTFLVQIFIKR